MNERQIIALVRAVLAQISEDYSVYQIEPAKRLLDFGIDKSEIDEFRARLHHTVKVEPSPQLGQLIDKLSIQPGSTIIDVAGQLGDAFTRPRDFSLPGIDPTKPKGLTEFVVRTALAQEARNYSFAEIKPSHRIIDLGIEDANVKNVRTKIYRGLTGKRPSIGLEDFSRALNISPTSTVREVVNSSFDSLPGYDPTRPKG